VADEERQLEVEESDEIAADGAPGNPEKAPPTPPPEGKKTPAGLSKPWVFTAKGVKIGPCEFVLRASPAVVMRYGEEAAVASQVYAVLTSAEAALSDARGECHDILERTRATVRARGLADDEIQRLTNVFCRFFEPQGIDVWLNGQPGRWSLSELATDLIEHLGKKE
jgi:hypothetical protein